MSMEEIKEKAVAGIDPGNAGGIAIIEGNNLYTFKMPDTYADIYETLKGLQEDFNIVIAFLERVGTGVPGQSSKATATFARHNGHLEMALYALGIQTEEVTPQKWQKFYSNQIGSSKGLTKTEWKNKLKGLAQRLYPRTKVTLNTADAILLAHYGKMNNL